MRVAHPVFEEERSPAIVYNVSFSDIFEEAASSQVDVSPTVTVISLIGSRSILGSEDMEAS